MSVSVDLRVVDDSGSDLLFPEYDNDRPEADSDSSSIIMGDDPAMMMSSSSMENDQQQQQHPQHEQPPHIRPHHHLHHHRDHHSPTDHPYPPLVTTNSSGSSSSTNTATSSLNNNPTVVVCDCGNSSSSGGIENHHPSCRHCFQKQKLSARQRKRQLERKFGSDFKPGTIRHRLNYLQNAFGDQLQLIEESLPETFYKVMSLETFLRNKVQQQQQQQDLERSQRSWHSSSSSTTTPPTNRRRSFPRATTTAATAPLSSVEPITFEPLDGDSTTYSQRSMDTIDSMEQEEEDEQQIQQPLAEVKERLDLQQLRRSSLLDESNDDENDVDTKRPATTSSGLNAPAAIAMVSATGIVEHVSAVSATPDQEEEEDAISSTIQQDSMDKRDASFDITTQKEDDEIAESAPLSLPSKEETEETQPEPMEDDKAVPLSEEENAEIAAASSSSSVPEEQGESLETTHVEDVLPETDSDPIVPKKEQDSEEPSATASIDKEEDPATVEPSTTTAGEGVLPAKQEEEETIPSPSEASSKEESHVTEDDISPPTKEEEGETEPAAIAKSEEKDDTVSTTVADAAAPSPSTTEEEIPAQQTEKEDNRGDAQIQEERLEETHVPPESSIESRQEDEAEAAEKEDDVAKQDENVPQHESAKVAAAEEEEALADQMPSQTLPAEVVTPPQENDETVSTTVADATTEEIPAPTEKEEDLGEAHIEERVEEASVAPEVSMESRQEDEAEAADKENDVTKQGENVPLHENAKEVEEDEEALADEKSSQPLSAAVAPPQDTSVSQEGPNKENNVPAESEDVETKDVETAIEPTQATVSEDTAKDVEVAAAEIPVPHTEPDMGSPDMVRKLLNQGTAAADLIPDIVQATPSREDPQETLEAATMDPKEDDKPSQPVVETSAQSTMPDAVELARASPKGNSSPIPPAPDAVELARASPKHAIAPFPKEDSEGVVSEDVAAKPAVSESDCPSPSSVLDSEFDEKEEGAATKKKEIPVKANRKIRFADETGGILVEEHLIHREANYASRIVVMLLSPKDRKFEFLHAEYPLDASTTVQVLLDQVPVLATNDAFRCKTFNALLQTETSRQLDNNLALQDYSFKESEIVLGVPDDFTVANMTKMAVPLLLNKKLMKTVKQAIRKGRGLKTVQSGEEWTNRKAS